MARQSSGLRAKKKKSRGVVYRELDEGIPSRAFARRAARSLFSFCVFFRFRLLPFPFWCAMGISKGVVELQLAAEDPDLCRDKAVELLKDGNAAQSAEW